MNFSTCYAKYRHIWKNIFGYGHIHSKIFKTFSPFLRLVLLLTQPESHLVPCIIPIFSSALFEVLSKQLTKILDELIITVNLFICGAFFIFSFIHHYCRKLRYPLLWWKFYLPINKVDPYANFHGHWFVDKFMIRVRHVKCLMIDY